MNLNLLSLEGFDSKCVERQIILRVQCFLFTQTNSSQLIDFLLFFFKTNETISRQTYASSGFNKAANLRQQDEPRITKIVKRTKSNTKRRTHSYMKITITFHSTILSSDFANYNINGHLMFLTHIFVENRFLLPQTQMDPFFTSF